MAGLLLHAVTGQVPTGTALKTILQVKAPQNQRLIVKEWSVSFEGTSNTAAPIQVDLVHQNTAGTMGGSITPKKNNWGDNETIQSSAQTGNTSGTNGAEPTAVETLMSELVHPQTGGVAALAA